MNQIILCTLLLFGIVLSQGKVEVLLAKPRGQLSQQPPQIIKGQAESLREILQAKHDLLAILGGKGDPARWELFTRDFRLKDAQGKISTLEEEIVAEKNRSVVKWFVIKYGMEIKEIEFGEERAVVTVRDFYSGFFTDELGRYGPVGKDHSFEADSLAKYTWVRTSNDWKIKYAELLTEPTVKKVDGRVIN